MATDSARKFSLHEPRQLARRGGACRRQAAYRIAEPR